MCIEKSQYTKDFQNLNKMKKSIYLDTFGYSPINKVLDFLTIYDQFDYSLTDIAKNAGISYSTLQLMWSDLENSGIVKQSRIVGKAKMYTINKKNIFAKAFIDFYWKITKSIRIPVNIHR
jgi:predicted transcriptional regulator